MRVGMRREMRGIRISWVRGRHVWMVAWAKVRIPRHHARWHHSRLVLRRGRTRGFLGRGGWLCFFLFIPVFGGCLCGSSGRGRVCRGDWIFLRISVFLFIGIFRRFIFFISCFRRCSRRSSASLGRISWISWRRWASLVTPVSVVLRVYQSVEFREVKQS